MSGLLGHKHHLPRKDLTVVSVFSDKELRVDLQERVLPCGHSGYWLSLYWYSSDKRDWVEIGILHGSDIERMIALLQDAHAFLKEL